MTSLLGGSGFRTFLAKQEQSDATVNISSEQKAIDEGEARLFVQFPPV